MPRSTQWPTSAAELVSVQRRLAVADPPSWRPSQSAVIGACVVLFERGATGPGAAGDRGWAAAALGGRAGVVVAGAAGGPYEPGLLALREGPLLEASVRALPSEPDVLLVDATGRDHPRRAGLALQLGAVLGIPTVGVTHRPRLAHGAWPEDIRGASSPLLLDREQVGWWLRTRRGSRPVAVHPAWRTDLDVALAVTLAASERYRTPEPLRIARGLARTRRAREAP